MTKRDLAIHHSDCFQKAANFKAKTGYQITRVFACQTLAYWPLVPHFFLTGNPETSSEEDSFDHPEEFSYFVLLLVRLKFHLSTRLQPQKIRWSDPWYGISKFLFENVEQDGVIFKNEACTAMIKCIFEGRIMKNKTSWWEDKRWDK